MEDSKGNKFDVGDTFYAEGCSKCIVTVIAINNNVATLEGKLSHGVRPRFLYDQNAMKDSKWILVK